MNLDFDFSSVQVTEFGVGREDQKGETFVTIPVDTSVQNALREMAETTWKAMNSDNGEPELYQPSEKHSATEYLYLPLNNELTELVRKVHKAAHLNIDRSGLMDPQYVFCYFARFTDKKRRHLTAMRRATQFKGILKSKNRLIRMLDDTLKVVEDTVFRLDNDFDLLADNANLHILRPSGFEFMAELQQAILDAVPENLKTIRRDLAFVDFDGIEAYATTHPRAARYLSSIRGQSETKNINKAALKRLCKGTGVELSELKGKILVSEGHEMGFLEVLDRRRYELNLVKGQAERFKAGSRTKLTE